MTQPGGAGPITLLHVFSTFAVGGPQTRFVAIAGRLGRKYRHRIVSMSGRTDAAKLLPDWVDFELVDVGDTKGHVARNVLAFRTALARLRPDVLVTYNWGALEWAIANRFGPDLPHLHIEDGFGPDETVKRLRRRIWLRKLGLANSRAIIVPSRTLERIALGEWRFPREQVIYLPNGIDLARFGSLDQLEPAFAKRPGELVVGTCAALRPEKNLARLIRAFAACGVADARLAICGEGPERPRLEAEATACGVADRVIFTGFLAQPERALACLDLFAMSSDTEQMPLGLLEAMAARLPAVATAVGDCKAIVAPENAAYVVSPADEAALARALGTLLSDSTLRTSLGAANRARVEREFGLDAMIDSYDRLFEAAAGRRTAE